MKFYQPLICLFLSLTVWACSSSQIVPQRLRYLISRKKFDEAAQLIEENRQGSSDNNALLYFLDEGMLLHYAGEYQKSIHAFEDAKNKYDELYTKSLSKVALSWLWNDESQPFYAEDFERALINIFQAMNYVMVGSWEDALVEARDMDSFLKAVNASYPPQRQNVYREDAFGRLLMGIFYETYGSVAQRDDAIIDYEKSLAAYENVYQKEYGVSPPLILIKNLIHLSDILRREKTREYQKKGLDASLSSIQNNSGKGIVYVFLYVGQIPGKQEGWFVLPIEQGRVAKISFPKLTSLKEVREEIVLTLKGASGQKYSGKLEVVEDLAAIAIKNLERRRMRLAFKAVTQPAFKYWLIRTAEIKIDEKYGNAASTAARYLGDLYKVGSQKSDLRSWLTLPKQIQMLKFVVKPGDYIVEVNDETLGSLIAEKGKTRFFVGRVD